jgi:hypothetical protein
MSRPQPMTRSTPQSAPPVTRRTNPMAIWSLILAIITLGGLGSIAGIIMGLAARRRVVLTGERGAGVAAAGIVIGMITLLLAIGYWVFIAVHMGGAGGSGGAGSGGGY